MNLKTAQKLDYWIGIPFCFLLSLINNISEAINFKRIKNNTVRKILFIKLTELGAIILSYPLQIRIKEAFPSADYYFLTLDRNKSVFKLLGGLIPEENILTIRERGLFVFMADTLKAIRKMRKDKINVVFDLEFFSRFSAVLAYLSGAHKRVGFYRYTYEGLYRGNILTHRFQYNPLIHISRVYLSLAETIYSDKKPSPELDGQIKDSDIVFPRYVSDNLTKEGIKNALGIPDINEMTKLLLLNPGEGLLPLREWPLDSFIALSKMLLEDENNYLILIGSDRATEKAELILRASKKGRCISLAGKTRLDELMALFNISHALISNDCGLVHLAMLTAIKKFTIFGPESPGVFGPLGENNYIIYSKWPCSPCLSILNHRNSGCKDAKCIKSIKADSVYGLIEQHL